VNCQRIDDGLLAYCAQHYPYPIAVACEEIRTTSPTDAWDQLGLICRDLFHPILQYSAHLILSDLVATSQRPAGLFHRIQAILSRPTTGDYIGFLRDAALHYRNTGLAGGVPKLVSFILQIEVDSSEPLLDGINTHRRAWAHGRLADTDATERSLHRVILLVTELLRGLKILAEYPLVLDEGLLLVGARPKGLDSARRMEVSVSVGGMTVRPLLLKLSKKGLALLEDADIRRDRLVYRALQGPEAPMRSLVKGKEARRLIDELQALLSRVRAHTVILPRPDWPVLRDRAAVLTDRLLSDYLRIGKYDPETYLGRPGWDGDDGIPDQFLQSKRGLLAISAEQGVGKSALAASFAQRSRDAGHIVVFINAQRLTYADPSPPDPIDAFLSRLLHFESGFSGNELRRIVRQAPPGKKLVFIFDGVNEVDGADPRWNRFRAMEVLLQWAYLAAEAGAKCIITFRADAYLQFDHLGAESLPDRLLQVTWTEARHVEPRLPWALRLPEFNESDARAFYDLQKRFPDRGLAPQMTWDTLAAAVGADRHTITSNPLLLGVLLRCHHGRSHPVASSLQELCQIYAAATTGATSSTQGGVVSRLWCALKTGGITVKERFVADLMQKMTQMGGASLLQENLDRRTPLDRRLLRVLDDPDGSLFDDLKECLLTVETIEHMEGDHESTSTRISFIAEMTTAILDSVERKKWRADRWKATFTMLALFSVGTIAAALTLGLILVSASDAQVSEMMPFFLYTVGGLCGVGVFGTLAFFVTSALSRPYRPHLNAWRDPLTRHAIITIINDWGRIVLPIMMRIAIFGAAMSIIIAATMYDAPLFNVMAAPLLTIVVAMLPILFVPALSCRLMCGGVPVLAPRVIKAVSRIALKHDTPDLRATRFWDWATIAATLCAGVFFVAVFSRLSPPSVFGEVALSLEQLEREVRGLYLEWQLQKLHKDLVLIVFGLAILAPLLHVVVRPSRMRQRVHPRVFKALAMNPRPEVHHRRLRHWAYGVFIATLISPLIAAGLVRLMSSHPDAEVEIEHFAHWVYHDATHGRRLVVTRDLTSDEQRGLQAINGLKSLSIEPHVRTVIQEVELQSIESLELHRNALGGQWGNSLTRLAVWDPDGDWPWAATGWFVGSQPQASTLRLEGAINGIGDLQRKFPRLRTLEIDEYSLDSLHEPVPLWSPNAVLQVHNDKPMRLKWLNRHYARFILSIDGNVSADVEHIELIQRLMISPGAIEPGHVADATRLQWLVIRDIELACPTWLQNIATILENSRNPVSIDLVSQTTSALNYFSWIDELDRQSLRDKIRGGGFEGRYYIGTDGRGSHDLLRAVATLLAEDNSDNKSAKQE